MLVVLGSAALGYFANRRWWLVVLIPGLVWLLVPLNTLSIFTVFTAGVVSFGVGMLIRRRVDRKRRPPEISD